MPEACFRHNDHCQKNRCKDCDSRRRYRHCTRHLSADGRCNLESRIIVSMIEVVEELVSFNVHILDHGDTEPNGFEERLMGSCSKHARFCLTGRAKPSILNWTAGGPTAQQVGP
jgi:hypothetical protein